MSENTVRQFAHVYRDGREDRKHARNPAILGLDKQLSSVAAEVLAGRYVETPLE